MSNNVVKLEEIEEGKKVQNKFRQYELPQNLVRYFPFGNYFRSDKLTR